MVFDRTIKGICLAVVATIATACHSTTAVLFPTEKAVLISQAENKM